MVKAYEYRSGYGSEEEQLKPLNRFLDDLDCRDIDYDLYTESTGKGVLFYVEYWED